MNPSLIQRERRPAGRPEPVFRPVPHGATTGQGLIDRHIFYDGRYIGTELTGIRFIDFARPRPMTPEERQDLLKSAFDASLW